MEGGRGVETHRRTGDVAQVGGYTGGVDDIVKGELRNKGGNLAEKRKRLWESQAVSLGGLGKDEERVWHVPGQCHQRHQQRLWEGY